LDREKVLVPADSPRYSIEEMENLRTLAAIRAAGISFGALMRLAEWMTESRVHRETEIPVANLRGKRIPVLAIRLAAMKAQEREAFKETEEYRALLAQALEG
jgi:hypothetical protein